MSEKPLINIASAFIISLNMEADVKSNMRRLKRGGESAIEDMW